MLDLRHHDDDSRTCPSAAMVTISQLIPDLVTITELPPSVLGSYLLEVLTGPHAQNNHGMIHLGNM